MKILVDTNVVSELKRGRNAAPKVVSWFAAVSPDDVFTSVVVLGEIRRGIALVARRDTRQAASLERWYGLMRHRLGNRVLDIDEHVMEAWARISVPDMLPAYDGLVAATALVHDLAVATRNTADYTRVGLNVINPWTDARQP